MKKNGYWKLAFLAFVTLSTLTGCKTGDEINAVMEYTPVPSESFETEHTPALAVGDKLPVSRALAAKMVSLAFSDKGAISAMDREISFTDTSQSLWYDKYINAASVMGYMSGFGDGAFMPEEPLTIEQAQGLLNAMNPENRIKIKIDDENRNKAISYALWCQLYTSALEDMGGESGYNEEFGIQETTFVVLASHGNNSLLPEGHIITDIGPYVLEGLSGDSYIDMEITVLEKGGEIIAVLRVETDEPVIKNAYIVSYGPDNVTLFSGGAEREYAIGSAAVNIPPGSICDVQISGSTCLNIVRHEKELRGKVYKLSKDTIEIGAQVYALGEDFKVYSIEDGPVKWKGPRNLLAGKDMATFIYDNNTVLSAVIDTTPLPDTIRVVLGNTNFESLVHDNITLTGTTGFTLVTPEAESVYSPGEELVFANSEEISGRIFAIPAENGRIRINSMERNGNKPEYRGIIEIYPVAGGFEIVNEVAVEEYLYSVVPSEMPVSYGLEALKVQAVTARSYAYNQFYANKYQAYGANVDDSVLSQVYNNTPETEMSLRAVEETAGQCLVYDGGVISANFFSTSSGMTANSGEVWANAVTKEFPTETSPYLKSKVQHFGPDFGDLAIEENAARFLKEVDITGYDSHISWFRWHLEMTSEEISASVNANLKQRYEADPALIKTQQQDGTFRSRPVETIGALINIEVAKRGAGGNIMVMKITGTENTILVSTEYNIRMLLRPISYLADGRDILINRKDGTQIANYSLMPSGFFTMERMTDGDGNILYVKFYGGGNGHGAGMSQNGVKGMIDSGYTFEQVLGHYYEGTEIRRMY